MPTEHRTAYITIRVSPSLRERIDRVVATERAAYAMIGAERDASRSRSDCIVRMLDGVLDEYEKCYRDAIHRTKSRPPEAVRELEPWRFAVAASAPSDALPGGHPDWSSPNVLRRGSVPRSGRSDP